ncbi:sensor domain-containing protein [Actinoplanes sp. NPDC024001]|uniref:sensor histidine kinase n=1 Tax=Actinoplanes sp. NPDC024001 TaxID=3154598 RepID=UPI0033FD2AE9
MSMRIKATLRALAYLATGPVAGAAGLLWSLAATLGVTLLAITQAGGPAFLGAAWLTRRLAGLERRRAGWVLGEPIPSPYLPSPDGPLSRRVAAVGTQPATWRDLAWLMILFPIGLVGGVVAIVTTLLTLGAIVAPVWLWAVPNPRAPFPADPLMTTTGGRFLLVVLGLLAAPLVAALLRSLAAGQIRLARALLAPGEHRRLVETAEQLARSRRRVVDAQAAELRRIERDLHDGAQARIVAAGMTLALTARKLRTATEPAEVSADVQLARRQLDDALAELRRLVRGIHPPILTDRGLAAALAALAGDSPVPVEIDADADERYPAAVESAAYFVVAEGLANAAKHAHADRCVVAVRRTPGGVAVRVSDDGRGGADPDGSGIDGLRRRVEALDGRLTLTSPPGGPTVLLAEMPCES